jgi:hypothetical protein
LIAKIPVPFRLVFTRPPDAGGSITNAQRVCCCEFATCSINGHPDKLPTSSSQVRTNVTANLGVAVSSVNTRNTSSASAQFAFMSKMPGP